MNPNEALSQEDMSPEELTALIDSLMASGTQHLNLTAGDTMQVETLSSTDCCKGGACAIPTLGEGADLEEETEEF